MGQTTAQMAPFQLERMGFLRAWVENVLQGFPFGTFCLLDCQSNRYSRASSSLKREQSFSSPQHCQLSEVRRNRVCPHRKPLA